VQKKRLIFVNKKLVGLLYQLMRSDQNLSNLNIHVWSWGPKALQLSNPYENK